MFCENLPSFGLHGTERISHGLSFTVWAQDSKSIMSGTSKIPWPCWPFLIICGKKAHAQSNTSNGSCTQMILQQNVTIRCAQSALSKYTCAKTSYALKFDTFAVDIRGTIQGSLQTLGFQKNTSISILYICTSLQTA